mmetsp:Transcript_89016/g.256664  ORF Transcript_89016/g.256664 Transcript_89016/m.256664 type:complete len:419 (-) Transcript_89016:663-1919(-)
MVPAGQRAGDALVRRGLRGHAAQGGGAGDAAAFPTQLRVVPPDGPEDKAAVHRHEERARVHVLVALRRDPHARLGEASVRLSQVAAHDRNGAVNVRKAHRRARHLAVRQWGQPRRGQHVRHGGHLPGVAEHDDVHTDLLHILRPRLPQEGPPRCGDLLGQLFADTHQHRVPDRDHGCAGLQPVGRGPRPRVIFRGPIGRALRERARPRSEHIPHAQPRHVLCRQSNVPHHGGCGSLLVELVLDEGDLCLAVPAAATAAASPVARSLGARQHRPISREICGEGLRGHGIGPPVGLRRQHHVPSDLLLLAPGGVALHLGGLPRPLLLGLFLLLLLPVHAPAILQGAVLHHEDGGLPREHRVGHSAVRHRKLLVYLGASHGPHPRCDHVVGKVGADRCGILPELSALVCHLHVQGEAIQSR